MISTLKLSENEQSIVFNILNDDVIIGVLSLTKDYFFASGHVQLNGWRFLFTSDCSIELPIGGHIYSMDKLTVLEEAISTAKKIKEHLDALVLRINYHASMI